MQKPSSESPQPIKKSSNFLLYIIIAVIGIFILFALLINIVSVRKRKFVAFRSVFVPPTSEELSKRQNMRQLQKRPYGNQFDRQSLIGDAAANTVYMPGLDNAVSFIEPAAKRFREEQQPMPQATPIQQDRIFTELHQHAASAEPISDAHIPRLIPCAKVVDSDGRTCIHWAIECVSDKPDSHVVEDIKKLVSIGCPIDAQDDSGATALHLAVRNGRTEVATYLLGHIDVNIQDDDGRTALFDAVSTKSLEMVQNILKVQNVDVNAVAHTNDTALIKCCRIDAENDMVSSAEALLKHPSIQIDKTGDKASANYNGRMAIHEAAACNSIQILKLLISRGAAVSAHDVHQQTPLFLAVQSNQTEAVKLLINQMRANKAEINASNDCDETPLQIAILKGFTEIDELLRNAGAQTPMPCMPIYPPIEHRKYPKMKAITGATVNLSPQFPNIERLSSNNNSVRRAKRKKAVPQPSTSSAQQQQQNMQNLQANAIAQQQVMMGLYPSNDPTFQMQAYAGMHQQILPYPYPPPQMSLSNYPQTSQPQIQSQQQQQQQYQQLQPNQTQRSSNLQQQNPPSNFSSNPPSAHLPQSLSVSPHVSDSAYGSPNSYQNSTTNTSGHSDTSSNFPSPPSSHDLWHNPSPDTVTGSTSTMIAPVQPSYAQTAPQIKQDYSEYVDNRYGCHSVQYPQQQNLDFQTQMYNSSTNLQYYPNSVMYPPSQHLYYHDSYQRQREPRIEYPQPTMHRSASFAAFDSQ
uniref:ANK_REP_REGION domain-containing protein n=1 Tax=Panagrolaimus davidi TaxID=227884 RepID=A0A914PFF1_9BILA